MTRCRTCKGSGLANEDALCSRCNGLGEAELTEEEKASDAEIQRKQLKELNRAFSGMLMDAGIHPAQRKRK